MGKKEIVFLLAVCSFYLTISSAVAQIIPDDHMVDWKTWPVGVGGVPNAIPNRTVQCGVTIDAATFGNGASDATSAIQNAINACPNEGVVKLSAGKFRVNGLRMKSNVTLRGNGPYGLQNTTLDLRDTILFATGGYEWNYATSTVYSLVGNLNKGDTQITTTTTNTWNKGDIVLIDAIPDGILVSPQGLSGPCGWCGRPSGGIRSHSQLVEVISKTGNTITFSPPLYSDYVASSVPQGLIIKGIMRRAGIEDMSIVRNGGGQDTIVFEANYKCWLKNVDISKSDRRHVWMYHGMWNEFRDSVFRDGDGPDWSSAYGPDQAYGIFIGLAATGNLIENNIFKHLHVPIAYEGGTSGNTVGYNYFTEVMYSEGETPQPAIAYHGSHPIMNLWEGNIMESKVLFDSYWGSSSHNTMLRNRLWIPTSKNGQTALQYFYDLDIWSLSRDNNIIGNVLGNPGVEVSLHANGGTYGTQTRAIYRIGATSAGDGSNDPDIVASTILHGNIDWVGVSASTPNLRWEPEISDHVIPQSLYLFAKPSWFGSVTWPPIGPDVTGGNNQNTPGGYVHKIPAQLRYEGNYSYLTGSANISTLSVTVVGTGSGKVTTLPAGIQCTWATCSTSFNNGVSITLTPVAIANSTFTGWSGACSGTGACSVTMGPDRSVTANFVFDKPTHPADRNSDFNVTASEFTAYNVNYKQLLSWIIGPSPPTSSYFSRALLLFKLGSRYHYQSGRTCPLCWVNGTG